MKFLIDFFHQKVPKRGAEMPAYFCKALGVCEVLLAIYFALMGVLLVCVGHQVTWVPFALCAIAFVARMDIKSLNSRLSLLIYAALACVWCAWYVRFIGWSNGSQPLLLTLLVLIFFDIHIGPWEKLACFAFLLGYRIALHIFGMKNAPIYILDHMAGVIFQTVSSITVYSTLACACVLFSTNIQDAERQLRLDNQELHKEAGTDPLTQLPNRRAMLDEISLFMKNYPDQYFCVAIAYIDFFKRINDTYGHPCGDYTLCRLADLFREMSSTKYKVARWGGEEFCFFLPGMNLDTAGHEMVDLNIAVSRMKLSFEGNDFSITITIGVDEYDFRSPVDDILENADQKLYMGKERGRNQVVI